MEDERVERTNGRDGGIESEKNERGKANDRDGGV